MYSKTSHVSPYASGRQKSPEGIAATRLRRQACAPALQSGALFTSGSFLHSVRPGPFSFPGLRTLFPLLFFFPFFSSCSPLAPLSLLWALWAGAREKRSGLRSSLGAGAGSGPPRAANGGQIREEPGLAPSTRRAPRAEPTYRATGTMLRRVRGVRHRNACSMPERRLVCRTPRPGSHGPALGRPAPRRGLPGGRGEAWGGSALEAGANPGGDG